MSDTVASATSTVLAATTSAASKTLKASPNLKIVGVILAIASGLLIGSSFVFKKKGLLRSQGDGELGEGVAYLKSALWWLGMSMMILGEICNFAAYAFVEAIVVTPLGALSVVVCAILSSIFLNEKLSFFGWLGCGLCILGSVIIALNGPKEETVGQIREFQKLFLAPGFLVFISILITTSVVIVFYFAPKYGKKSMLWYIFVCSMIGGISVSVTTGLGAAIVQTALGDNQFKFWFMYFLFGFVVVTLLVEVYYLNVALALFNTAMVTPTYYVIFTFFSMVTTIVLFQGLHAGVTQIITIVMGFLVICLGITILQMSKVDPEKLNKLDRRSTLLLQAARVQADGDDEKGAIEYENPGMDTLRGSFGTVGSIIRARTVRRMSQSSQNNTHLRMRPAGAAAPYDATASWMSSGQPGPESASGMKRHQLYDAPMPRDDTSSIRAPSVHSQLVNKRPTIKFDSQDMVHQYNRPGQGDNAATHEHRQAAGSSMLVHDGYPPLPPLPSPGGNSSIVASPTVMEGNLLEMDSPEMSKNAGPSAIAATSPNPNLVISPPDQMLDLPPLMGQEHVVHSAPPTIYARFARGGNGGGPPVRKDSREIFEKSPSTARGTLLSFPSVTDSAPSDWDDEDEAESERERVRGREREKEKERLKAKVSKENLKERSRERGRTGAKKYPGAGADEDDEESMRLWKKAESTEDEGDGALPPDAGGIRLVQTNHRGQI
ncbi:magnesium transporter NIPA-domain-containing protein [Crassisporium funariophilum]|nr:magnesium transporter NIPA-domain-containing protein [Crassisporium funariophilum]